MSRVPSGRHYDDGGVKLYIHVQHRWYMVACVRASSCSTCSVDLSVRPARLLRCPVSSLHSVTSALFPTFSFFFSCVCGFSMPPMRFSSPASLYALVGWISASVLPGRLPVVSGLRSQIHRFTSYNVKLTTV